MNRGTLNNVLSSNMTMTILTLLALLTLCVALRHEPNPSTSTQVEVTTKYGILQGLRFSQDYGLGDDAVTSVVDRYLKVPYAAPPTKENRFEPPGKPTSWEGTRDAQSTGPWCPQTDPVTPQSEDCLYLDIYSPWESSASKKKYPVMMYIHGGSLEFYSNILYDGHVMAQYGVVVVIINYRLGALGYLAFPGVDNGNYGLLDQIEALTWIKENIAEFRGDPEQVTVMGNSAGGAAVGALILTSKAKGLFHRAIAMSGSIFDGKCFGHHGGDRMNRTYILRVADLFGCKNEDLSEVKKCLKQIETGKFLEKRDKFPLWHMTSMEFRHFIDGEILEGDPATLVKREHFNKVPVIIGSLKTEFGGMVDASKGGMNDIVDGHVSQALGHHNLQDIVHVYYSSKLLDDETYYRGQMMDDMCLHAPTVASVTAFTPYVPTFHYYFDFHDGFHTKDLNYIFGGPFTGAVYDQFSGSIDYNKLDKDMSRSLLRLWTSFMKEGEPKDYTMEELSWSKSDPNPNKSLHLSLDASGFSMATQIRPKTMKLWNIVLPKVLGLLPGDPNVQLEHLINEQQPSPERHHAALIGVGIVGSTVLLFAGIAYLVYARSKFELVRRQNSEVGQSDARELQRQDASTMTDHDPDPTTLSDQVREQECQFSLCKEDCVTETEAPVERV